MPKEVAAEYVAPQTLKPWANNPRKNDGASVARVAASIERFGFAAPIVARRETREIVAGHTRWKAALSLKLDRVPVRFIDLEEREAHLLALADNRYTELTEWDDALLADALKACTVTEAVFAGWDATEVDRIMSEVAQVDGKGDVSPEPASDDSSKVMTDFAVLIECTDEKEQLAVLAQVESLGWKGRALV